MSNEKEQFDRFCQVISMNLYCENCPIKEKCHDEGVTTENINHTCEETIWHYIKTGEFLL